MIDLKNIEFDLYLVNNFRKIAKEYGVFAEKISVEHPGSEATEYIVFSLSPIQKGIDPVSIINRNNRNTTIFYPENFAVELHKGNPFSVWEKIASYLAHAEFMYEVYEEFEKPLPKAIRTDELSALVNFYNQYKNPNFDALTRGDYLNGLREFFKEEYPKSKFKREWQEFYRSELYDGNKSFWQNYRVFKKRLEPEVALDVLVGSCDDLSKVYMPEHRYQEFRSIIQSRYPEVKYYAGKKEVIDKGIIVDPKTNERVKTPYGITVTKEEYDKVMDARFAAEGFSCVDDLNVSYFEGREIIYKSSDENIIASISNAITFRWARPSTLDALKQHGLLSCIEIPNQYITTLCVDLNYSQIPFYIDNRPAISRFGILRIVFNSQHEEHIRNVLIGLNIANVDMAHLSLNNENISFSIQPDDVAERIRITKEHLGITEDDYRGNSNK
ncbi:MAG: hypothetical protein J6A88_07190 [Oscillospiraceae bacterium]|nr:hypothetical protein [Oscillospiraceae bacterium]